MTAIASALAPAPMPTITMPGTRRFAQMTAPSIRYDVRWPATATPCGIAGQTVITTMKTYGLILADNGSNWYFQGTADTRWTYNQVDQLKGIPASAFVAVDESCLMVSASYGEAYQPETAGYESSCG